MAIFSSYIIHKRLGTTCRQCQAMAMALKGYPYIVHGIILSIRDC